MQRFCAPDAQKSFDGLLYCQLDLLLPVGADGKIQEGVEMIRKQLDPVVLLLLCGDIESVAAFLQEAQGNEVSLLGGDCKEGNFFRLYRSFGSFARHQNFALFFHMVQEGEKLFDILLRDIRLFRIAFDMGMGFFAAGVKAQASAAFSFMAFCAKCIEDDGCFDTRLLCLFSLCTVCCGREYSGCRKEYADDPPSILKAQDIDLTSIKLPLSYSRSLPKVAIRFDAACSGVRMGPSASLWAEG